MARSMQLKKVGTDFGSTKVDACRYSHVSCSTFFLLVGIVLTLGGVWIRWRASDYSMSAEEAMKNRKLTSEQVFQRLILIRRSGLVLTFAGMALLIISVMLGAR